jgi:hypothetical protein
MPLMVHRNSSGGRFLRAQLREGNAARFSTPRARFLVAPDVPLVSRARTTKPQGPLEEEGNEAVDVLLVRDVPLTVRLTQARLLQV